MDFYRVVEKRRTVRDFAEKPVPKEKIARILDAGINAPSYNHLREWDFIFIRDAAIRLNIVLADKVREEYTVEELEKAFGNHEQHARDMYLEALPKQRRMLLSASELLIVTYKPKTSIPESRTIYDLNGLASVWCCIENILLAMAAEDLYGVTFVPQYPEKIKEILGIPTDREIATLLPFGYRGDTAKDVVQKHIDLKDRIHVDTW